ncbi:MAG: hypothetical protein CME59_11015 [Halioglobus sp.]|nr:hypothetical protein [Halioglobus sp.]|tara:strand:+ start:2231 stop:2533 length:303 start_codon:yes stop_codon:yes gene_type:complete
MRCPAAALRRAVLHGDGWYGVGHTLDGVAPVLQKLRDIAADRGRDFASLQITTACHTVDRDELRRREDLGVTRLVVTPWERGRDAVAGLQRLADAVLHRD